ncbi:MAG: hypothetical protein VW297_11755 [Paracoccaceae bacterium]
MVKQKDILRFVFLDVQIMGTAAGGRLVLWFGDIEFEDLSGPPVNWAA